MRWIKEHKVLSVFLAVLVLYLGWSRYDSRFTPQRWARTSVSQRGKMVKDLLKQYDGLEGMTRTEVEELLGADTDGMQIQEAFFPDGTTERTPMLVYAVGGRPWAMFPEYLHIYLEDGRVIQARLVAD